MPMLWVEGHGVVGGYMNADRKWIVDTRGRYMSVGSRLNLIYPSADVDDDATLFVLAEKQATPVEMGFCAGCDERRWKEPDAALCPKCAN